MPLRFFARVFGNPAGDPVLLKSRGLTLLRDICRISCLPNGTFPLKQTCKEMKGREVCCTKWITAYKQIYLYSIPPSNISTTVDIICIFLHVNVNVIVSFITVLGKSMPMCHLPQGMVYQNYSREIPCVAALRPRPWSGEQYCQSPPSVAALRPRPWTGEQSYPSPPSVAALRPRPW